MPIAVAIRVRRYARIALTWCSKTNQEPQRRGDAAAAVASAAIIGSLPPVVATLISITAPDYMRPLFTDPRGHLMLMAGAFWMTIGVLSMRKMINFKM